MNANRGCESVRVSMSIRRTKAPRITQKPEFFFAAAAPTNHEKQPISKGRSGVLNLEDLLPDVWKASHPQHIRTFREEERQHRADERRYRHAERRIARVKA